MNILFVCTGNTCRSPMAAALMNEEAIKKNLDVRIESAGIMANEGECASGGAVEVMHDYGIDLTEHKAKQITEELLKQCDLILTMTENHKKALEQYAPGKVYTLAEYAGVKCDIADPFGGDISDYRRAAGQISELVEKAAEKLEKETKQ